METIKSWINDHFMFCVSAIAFSLCIIGWWLLYTDSRTANDYHDAVNSVEHVEAGIDSAGKQLESAQSQIKDAQNELERADKTTRHLKHTTGTNKKLIDECTGITDRMSERARSIQAIIRNAETANQADGTQTNCNP